ncbi:MAG: GNAT family N-acetyltransferase [Clostridia bacterium]|nr:GNAT family N-acetyltransferase [Clostridia bacterium]
MNQTHGVNFNNISNATKITYLVVDEINTLIGIVEIIFYCQTDYQFSAHVVECIRPTQRRKGYGKLVRKKAIEECNSFGIKKDKISFECNSKACNDTMKKLIDF